MSVEPRSILQLVDRGRVEQRALLPSFTYFASDSDGPLALPWDERRRYAVGEYARSRGAEAPLRVVSSAKSWLSDSTCDRREALLPINAPEDVEKVSPVEATWRYLDHLAELWVHDSELPGELAQQELIITVPASFDAGARDLTIEAAFAAGLENVTLLEEPQAALYGLIEASGDRWRELVQPGDVVLVVDVGGGTTDFSAIALSEVEGKLECERIAVGDHILLGGDNMDLALAHAVRQKLEADGQTLDSWQMLGLVHTCRGAKERLLGDEVLERVNIAVASRGSQLLGNTISTELTRDEVERLVVDGFFPRSDLDERPLQRPRTALTQKGLPYASDPAVTKHLAAFLAKQAGAGTANAAVTESHQKLLAPTAVLFNGGVFKSSLLRGRLMQVLNVWLEANELQPARVLESRSLDVSVARGAAYYGLVRHGRGLRIKGGTARSYYVGIESPTPAVPGFEPPLNALCVAPFGLEEGSEPVEVAAELGLVVGEAVRFRFFSSTSRRTDKAGDVLEDHTDYDLSELAPVEVILKAEGRETGSVVSIQLRARVTELGSLSLEAVPMEALHEDEAWQVELNVRS